MPLVIHRSSLICFALLVFSSCSTSVSDSDAEEARQISAQRAAARLTPAWLNPRTLQLHNNSDKPDNDDLVLRGQRDGWIFLPEGDVQGTLRTAPQSSTLKKCRLLLANRSLVFSSDTTPLRATYLEGVFDSETKLFYPSSRQCLTTND